MIEKLKQLNFATSPLFDNKRVAVALTSYNRPHLLQRVIESMNRCDELEQVPVFLYCDGGSNAKQNESIEAFKKLRFKNKIVVKRDGNYGCDKNTLYCLDDILNKLEFDYMFLVEDDIQVGKGYFKLCYDSYKHVRENIDPNIGMFQGHSMCFMTPEQKKDALGNFDKVEGQHLWGFMTKRETYMDLKDIEEELTP